MKRKYLIVLIFILVVFSISNFLSDDFEFSNLFKISIKEVKAQGWLDSWDYRREIIIDNTGNASNLTDYQVLVTIDTASLIPAKMASCDEIRFTDSDEITDFDCTAGKGCYWIEDGTCNTANTNIWVKVPLIAGSSLKTIYMYYGNLGVVSRSDGDNTFVFFDNFNTDKWTDASSNVYVDTTNSRLYIHTDRNETTDYSYINQTIPDDFEYKFRYYQESESSNAIDFVGLSATANGTWNVLTDGIFLYFYGGSSGVCSFGPTFYLNRKIGGSTAQTNYYCGSLDNWYTVYLRKTGNTASIELWNSNETTLYLNESLSVSGIATLNYLYATGRFTDATHNGHDSIAYVDSVKLNEYSSPSPTVSSVGAEQFIPVYLSADWTHYKLVTIDSSKIDEDLTDFPVLVKLTNANFDFSEAEDNGLDIRFCPLTATLESECYSYERERHDKISEQAEYWVNIDSVLSSANTEFYMYYGKSDASNDEDPTAVWDSNFLGVWHLSETSGSFQDSSINNNDGIDLVSDTGKSGKIGLGQDFDVNNDYIDLSSHTSDWAGLDSGTIEAWVYHEDAEINYVFWVSDYNVKDEFAGFFFHSANELVYWYARDTAPDDLITTDNALPVSAWSHIVIAVTGGNSTAIYVNGEAVAVSGTNAGKFFNDIVGLSDTYIGAGAGFSASSRGYGGGPIDEVRISNTARSAAWVKASYYSGNDELLTLGVLNQAPDQPVNPSPSNGLTGVSTSLNLSVDVSDLNSDTMDVSFYDAFDDSLIGTNSSVISGGTATVNWGSITYGNTYQWYTIADDGTDSTQSSTWSFTTSQASCENHNVWGYSWSENVGWISMSCENCDVNDPYTEDPDGFSNGAVGCPIAGTVIPNYGVDIDGVTGKLSGYAWSENIGWISFADFDGDEDIDVDDLNIVGSPCAPNCEAVYDFDGTGSCGVIDQVCGWARALAYGDGWDGWIKLKGNEYNVSINTAIPAPFEFEGWAWGGDDNLEEAVIGWISFNCNDGGYTEPAGPSYSVCGSSDYKVLTDVSFIPPNNRPFVEPDTAVITGEGYCAGSPNGLISLEWVYKDDEGDDQDYYYIRVADNPGFGPLIIDCPDIPQSLAVDPAPAGVSGTAGINVVASGSSCSPLSLGYTGPGTDYYWRVSSKSDDGDTNYSAWESDPLPFQTPSHAYPKPDFTWAPQAPSQEEVVIFDPSSSLTYGGSSISSYLWTITEGTGQFVDSTDNTSQIPHITFSTANNKVKLSLTDSSTYSCESLEKTITTTSPLPEWREVPPTGWLENFLANILGIFKIT